MASVLNKNLRSFISRYIGSVEQLEILCLLASEPFKRWTVEEVFRLIQSNQESVEERLKTLVAAGFLKATLLTGIASDQAARIWQSLLKNSRRHTRSPESKSLKLFIRHPVEHKRLLTRSKLRRESKWTDSFSFRVRLHAWLLAYSCAHCACRSPLIFCVFQWKIQTLCWCSGGSMKTFFISRVIQRFNLHSWLDSAPLGLCSQLH